MRTDKPKKPEIGIVKNQDFLESLVKYSYISIGSNLGDKKKIIEKAKYLINKKKIEIVKCSSTYETYAWPNKNDPKFYNVVIKIQLDYLKFCNILKNL